MRRRLAWLLSAGLGIASLAAAADGAGEPILVTGGYWRAFTMSAPPEFADGDSRPQEDGDDPENENGIQSLPPQADWMQPQFDDADWYRSPGPFGGLPRGGALLCLRGKFAVADPAGVRRLTLSMAYAGGVIVYLNGREVLRRDMPPGALAATQSACPYPVEAYVDAKGGIIPDDAGEDLTGRIARRRRSFREVVLPTAALRRGVNVLAVELHRSVLRPEARGWDSRRRAGGWAHIGLRSIELAVVADAGAVAANLDRPDGPQVYVQDIHRVFSNTEYGEPNEPTGTVRLACARNGLASGQVVVSSAAALEGVSATCGDLAAEAGAKIPAAAVRLRYGVQARMRISADHAGLAYAGWSPIPAFASLVDEPPAKIVPEALNAEPRERAALGLPPQITPAAILPIWLTVRVPKDAAAGTYRGRVSIRGKDVAADVPVEIEVIGWSLPGAAERTTFMALNQSPETLAVQYGVPLWSQKHWELMERSWQLQGLAGNNLLVVPLVCRTQYGSDDSYVPITPQADGGWKYDFTVHDRLVALARRHCDIRVIAYQVYLASGWTPPGPDKPTFITEIDPATGERRRRQLPAYDTPESTRLWKPLLEQLRTHLAQLGLGRETAVVLGIGQDGGVNDKVRAHFAAMWPGIRWQYGAHNRRPSFYEIGRGTADRTYFGYSEYLYVGGIPPAGRGPGFGWRINPVPTLMSQRIHDGGQDPQITRTMAERALVRGDSGAGRMCLDYWDVPDVKTGSHFGTMYSRWPDSSADQRTPHLKVLSYPGPAGAVPSIKLLPMREGLQETEARIFIERALADGRLDADLARRAQSLLNRRLAGLRMIDYLGSPVRATFNGGWRREAAELYRMAAEVAAAVRDK